MQYKGMHYVHGPAYGASSAWLQGMYVLRSVLHILPSNYNLAKSVPLYIYVESPASPAMYVSGDSSQCHETYFQGLATLLEPLIPPKGQGIPNTHTPRLIPATTESIQSRVSEALRPIIP